MTKPYKYLLSKKDLKHLMANGITSMDWIKKNMTAQVEMRKNSRFEPCYACKDIARKLKLPT